MLKQRDMIKQRIGALVAGDGTLEVIIQELTRMRDEGVDRQQVESACHELREEAACEADEPPLLQPPPTRPPRPRPAVGPSPPADGMHDTRNTADPTQMTPGGPAAHGRVAQRQEAAPSAD